MKQNGSDYRKLLKHEGIKNTRHRNAILGMLDRTESPLTADEIFIGMKMEDSSICLSTVYRILDVLTLKGIVQKSVAYGSSKARFCLDHHDHKHCLICLGCKKEVALDRCPLGNMEKTLAQDTDFDVTGHKLEIYGYCPDCKEKNPVQHP